MKVHPKPNLILKKLNNRMPKILTKRMLSSNIASQFHPLALIVPIILQVKILMRKFISEVEELSDGKSKKNKYDWDNSLPATVRDE